MPSSNHQCLPTSARTLLSHYYANTTSSSSVHCWELLDSCLQDLPLSSTLLDTTFTYRDLQERLLLQDDRDITFYSYTKTVYFSSDHPLHQQKNSELEVTQEFKSDTILINGPAMLHCDSIASSSITENNKRTYN